MGLDDARFAVRLMGSCTVVSVVLLAAGAGSASALPAEPKGCSGNGSALVTCDFDVPPGRYRVALMLPREQSSAITVSAEARRTVLTQTSSGRRPPTFAVDVREPEGEPTAQGGSGTPGLQLRISASDGSPVAVTAVRVTALRHVRTLFLAGDSTVCDQANPPYTGWGQQLPQYFDQHLMVANYADSGESSGSFLDNEALMPAMERRINPGDFVMVQFGHNDKTTTAVDYRRNLGQIIDRIAARGGRAILVTPPVRQLFGADGKLTPTALHVNSLGVNLPDEMRSLAAERELPLIDLTAGSQELLQSLGPSESSVLYLPQKKDRTHFSEYGADRMAQVVLAAAPISLRRYLRQ
ncbi:rhamnogalacturonan acetylesterase [Kribbella sp. NPDC005582]|uniref:rhamnogalacturonan acetylesterase n=1 Tax=Kribbella sp. NPDC005582 TaxID=3156893 RepID=UPI0033AB1CF3